MAQAMYEKEIQKYMTLLRHEFTRRVYVSTIRRFLEEEGQISRAAVEGFLARQAEKYGRESVRRMLAALKGFFDFLVLEGKLERNPARNIRIAKIEDEIEHYLSIEEMEKLITYYRGKDPIQVRNRAILELMYATGALPEDICRMRLHHALLARQGWVRMCARGRTERPLPIGRYAAAWLAAWLKLRPQADTDALFINYQGGPLSRVSVWEIVRRAAAAVGLENVNPRTIRNTFIMHMRDCDKRVLQYMLGTRKIGPIKRRASI